MNGVHRDIADVVVEARLRGWQVERTRNGHLRLRHPTGALVFASTTPGSWRAGRQLRADLRRVERTCGEGG